MVLAPVIFWGPWIVRGGDRSGISSILAWPLTFLTPLAVIAGFGAIRRWFRLPGRSWPIALVMLGAIWGGAPLVFWMQSSSGESAALYFNPLAWLFFHAGTGTLIAFPLVTLGLVGAAAWDRDRAADRRRSRKVPGDFVLREPD